MAKNLRSKISSSDTLIVFDVNATATEQFLADVGSDSHTAIAKDVREVAEKSVCSINNLLHPYHSPDEHVFPIIYDLSWGRVYARLFI